MGIDYLIIVLFLITFLGFLSLSFIYFPFKTAWNRFHQCYRQIIGLLSVERFPNKTRNEPSLRNTGLDTLKLTTPQPSHKKTIVKKAPSSPPLQPSHALTVLYVIAEAPSTYNGYTLWQALIDQNLIYGDSQIFHAYAKDKVNSILFSVAGAVEPGYFDVEHIADIRLPGLCLFMQNDATPYPLDVFDYMLEVAKRLAHHLGGVVCDNKRQILSENMLEIYQAQLSLLTHQS